MESSVNQPEIKIIIHQPEDDIQQIKNDDITICLTMILGNESAIIERCLEAARFAYDYVCVSFNGKDNTDEVITKYCEKNKIPFKIYYEKWSSFGECRTKSYKNTQDAFPNADFQLLLDADMILVNNGFNRKELIGVTHGFLEQKDPYNSYHNVRFIDNNYKWRSYNRTHEYTDFEKDEKAQRIIKNIPNIEIDDRGDGGSKADKTDRDIKLLIEDIEEDNNNVRAMFYLANTYRGIGRFLEAIHWYKLRINNKSDFNDSEKWNSTYYIAECYRAIKDYPNAEYYYNLAINLRPYRPEPYTRMAYMWVFEYEVPRYFFAVKLLELGIPLARKNDILFNENECHTWLPWYILCVAYYYLKDNTSGALAKGKYACKKAVSFDNIPADKKEHITKNILPFYE